ncbi:MAG TPA: type IX secretion system sortase PorU [Bacteroidales bacterium]|nr:type IX secretion system sortase PorU [Bacteroidales bacterium]
MKITRIIIMFLFSALNAYAFPLTQAAGEKFADESVLATGKWFKIAVIDEGVYRIPFSTLQKLGLTNPANPRIYGNNFGQLSYYNDSPKPDDLKEIAILLVTGTDGIFNEGDYLLFYAQSTHRWKYDRSTDSYRFIRHNYSDTAYYFLTSSPSPGKYITTVPSLVSAPDYTSFSHDALFIHEIESENLLKSGREWYQPVSALSGIQIRPGFSGLVTGEELKYRLRVLGRSSVPVMFRLYEGETIHAAVLVPEVNLFSTTGIFARDVTISGTLTPSSQNPSFEVKFYNNGEQSAKGWLDYLELQGRANTAFNGKTLIFSDSRSVAPGRITEFNVKSSSASISIWDVTNPFEPVNIQFEKTGDYCRFRISTDSIRKFIVFSYDGTITPVINSVPVPNQNLHASPEADMVIVTHPLFYQHAVKLAGIHNSNSGLTSIIVTPEEIYNEFSGGIPDIVAIRNFLRMKFLKQSGTSHPLKYLLLFGDGSYDNKKLPPRNPNFIPTYQSQNSTIVTSSFVSDDFYGLLEDGEGEATGTEDIGIGRFPVIDTMQASVILSKIIRYMDPSNGGDWRNMVVLTADDEDSNTHMNDSEGLSSLIETKYPEINIEKIYLDAFRQVTSINGQSYPDVEKAINDRINSGCIIFNYLGHGNEVGLAHERVVRTQSVNSWKNDGKLPLFITATCEFSRFDDAELNPFTGEMTAKSSAGEMVLLNPDGGGIALMSTTRVVYSAPNYTLNRNIMYYAFERDSTGELLRLGDVIRLAKNNSGSGMNKRNFTLLGDPALRLAYPWHGRVVTDSINGVSITSFTDTLKAVSVVTVSGHIEDNKGNYLNDFNGLIFPVVFDKSRKIKTLANDGGQPMEFYVQNSIVFSGKTKVNNGRFRFSFIVPRDIDYSFGNGKISYYAKNDKTDMNGAFSNFIIGGFSSLARIDTTGPEIRLFLNDTLFRNGDISDSNPVLLAKISDLSGINTTGAGIGHDITAWLDEERNSSFSLNNYFETDMDNYTRGTVKYRLNNISEGVHTLSLKAWDNFNNSAVATLKFVVRSEGKFIINDVSNYPNPVTSYTYFTAGHNRPDKDLYIIIEIFDMSGRKVKILEENLTSTGYRLPPIYWDGTIEGGKKAGRGIYAYVVTIKTGDGETARASGRLIIL